MNDKLFNRYLELMALKQGQEKNSNCKSVYSVLMEEFNLTKFAVKGRIRNHPNYKNFNNGTELFENKENKSENKEIDINKSNLSINSDGTQTSDRKIKLTDENLLKDTNYLMSLHGYDFNKFELVNAKSSQWETQIKGGSLETLYSSKITVKPIQNAITEQDISNLIQMLESKSPYRPKHNIKSKKMLEVNICDLHIGKLAWHKEVGQDYDYKIATKRFEDTIEDILYKTRYEEFEKILFVFGNDFYNFSTSDGATINKTPQDNDSRYKKMCIKGEELLIKSIERLSEKSNVEVLMVEGNHDAIPTFHSMRYMSAWFRNAQNVTVSEDIKTRKYYNYGKCLIGFTHGDKEMKRLPSLMQNEAAELWGKTLYREYHCAHFHSEQVQEHEGIIRRHLSSITGTDSWHFDSGYISALAKAQSFIWDKDNGLENIIMSNVR